MMIHKMMAGRARRVLSVLYKQYILPLLQREVLRIYYCKHYAFGLNPLRIVASACVNNAFFNTMSRSSTVEENFSFGQNVCVLTGIHNGTLRDKQRQDGWPASERDVTIRRGAWIASNATILGPCEIGEHAVVAAGAVVIADVPANPLVGGVPARIIREI